ncbi:metallo-beta-lactamase domain-containing protein 1 [Numenius arquata]|uniref:metallo-beta-lactamase domain-containing protein 1 n=1 Tax=Numenius arquata TaxID=31919 RepID=UPI003D304D2A
MPRGFRTAPLGLGAIGGVPYSLWVLQEGYSRPHPDGTLRADGTVTLVAGGGPVTALVDTGGPWGGPSLLEKLGSRGVSPEDVTHLVCTHGHSDHVGNLNLFPAATLVLGYDVCRGAGRYVPNGLAEGRPYVLDPGHLEVVATPGHTRSHVSLVARATSLGTVVVAGDLFEREGDEGEWEALSEDPREQERSRRRVVAMADVIVPGHGPPFRVIKEWGEEEEEEEEEEGATTGDATKA